MKTITTLTATLGAALLLAGAPALASADSPTAPVRIDAVQLVSQSTSDYAIAPVAAEIAFTNEGSAPATDVVFAVESESGYVLDSYNDVGSFGPGVTVRHSFNDHNFAIDGERVAVAKVTFADGSVWTNPDVQLEAAAPAPAGSVEVSSYSLDY
ncbi:MAG: hypothetical protein ABSH03_19385 [Candidatus Lustribacter sp.]|jgi:hypothetical protein